MKILIIEDDKIIGLLLKEVLENEGYNLEIAETGIDGLKICNSIYTGKDKYGNILVIIISGTNIKKLELEALKFGAIDFIEKPINMDKLIF